jgi:type VI protein secretion system component VasF
VKSEPETQVTAAAAGRDHLRTSRADREHVINVLKAAFVQGRLSKDEFEARIAWALTSRTYAELAAVTADVPAALTLATSSYGPARRRVRVRMNTAVTGGACVAIATNLAMIGALMVGNVVVVIAVMLFFVIAAAVAIGAMIVAR